MLQVERLLWRKQKPVWTPPPPHILQSAGWKECLHRWCWSAPLWSGHPHALHGQGWNWESEARSLSLQQAPGCRHCETGPSLDWQNGEICCPAWRIETPHVAYQWINEYLPPLSIFWYFNYYWLLLIIQIRNFLSNLKLYCAPGRDLFTYDDSSL